MRAALLVTLAACSDSGNSAPPTELVDAPSGAASCYVVPRMPVVCGDSNATSAVVLALAGDVPEPGAIVATSRSDGTIIRQTVTDSQGCATLPSEQGALITAVFPEPHLSAPASDDAVIVTTLAPTSGQLAIHSPVDSRPLCPSLTDFRIAIDQASLPSGTSFTELDLGVGPNLCHYVKAALPNNGALPIACLGSDGQLDYELTAEMVVDPVLVRPIGFSAGRVPVINGIATLPSSWGATQSYPCSVAVDPALSLYEGNAACSYVADGFTFLNFFSGLHVDETNVLAAIGPGGEQLTQFRTPGLPSTLPIGPGDFLPSIPAVSIVADPLTMHLRWTPDLVSVDAVLVHGNWYDVSEGGLIRDWYVMLPAATSEVVFPSISTTPALLPDAMSPAATFDREYIDSDAIDSFDALLAGGLHFESKLGAFMRYTGRPVGVSPESPRIRYTYAPSF